MKLKKILGKKIRIILIWIFCIQKSIQVKINLHNDTSIQYIKHNSSNMIVNNKIQKRSFNINQIQNIFKEDSEINH